jgi:hypothetical protein
MAGVARQHPAVANLIGEMRFAGKEVTLLAIDWDVDADGSDDAMIAIINSVQKYGNILMAGAVYDTGTKMDVMIEGDLSGSDYKSADGTVTGTVGQALVEDLINLGTVDGVDFTSGTVAVTVKTTLKWA